jgi:hypothetical protein
MNTTAVPLLDDLLLNRSNICNSIHLLSLLHGNYKVDTVSITKDESGKAVISFVVNDLEE